MQRVIAVLLITTLALPACAPALASLTPRQADTWRQFAGSIPIGSAVKVRTTPGERFTGVLIAVDDTGIEVSPKTRIPEPNRRVAFDRIAQVEMKKTGEVSFAKVAAVAGAVGAGAAVGVFMLLLIAYDD
jgi:hypothetical protein